MSEQHCDYGDENDRLEPGSAEWWRAVAHGLQAKFVPLQQEIARLRDERDAMQRRAEAAEADMVEMENTLQGRSDAASAKAPASRP